MSALEDETKPILLRLIDGNWAGNLTPEDSRVLARWSAKTALAIHAASFQDQFVPIEHYRIVAAGGVPERVVVAAAKIQAQGDYFWIQSQNWHGKADDLNLDDFRRTYRITMQFGQLAVRVHY